MTEFTRAVSELIARSGILKQLVDEDAANRSAQHADLRARKTAALALFQKQKPAADAAVAAADKKADDARKLADQALQDYINARAKLDSVYGTLSSTVDPIDKEMRACADPAIDAAIAQLDALKSDCPNLFRLSADGKSDNRVAVQARVIALNEAIEAAQRLKIDATVSDHPAAVAAILATIPEA